MKREETYCDVCGKQMSYLDSDHNREVEGIRLLYDITVPSGTHLSPLPAIKAFLDKRHSCGTSGKMEEFNGNEFCSFSCFDIRMQEFMRRVETFFK